MHVGRSLTGRLRRDMGLRPSRVRLHMLSVVVARSLEAGSRIDGGRRLILPLVDWLPFRDDIEA